MTKIFKSHKKIFFIILFSILFAICLIIANYLAAMLIKTENKSEDVSTTETTIYMLSLSKSQVKKEAESIAPDFQKIGAGGFVWQNNGYFHLISSAYLNKNDAELVKNSIKINQNLNGEILPIKFKSFSLSGSFSSEEKKVISKVLSSAQIFYTSVYDIAVSLDTGVYNEISAKLEVNNVTNNISTIFANFNTLYPSEIKGPMTETKNFIKKMVDISQKLASDERINKSQTYSSNLKYRYLEALSEFYSFISD